MKITKIDRESKQEMNTKYYLKIKGYKKRLWKNQI